jgi:hypothetical protein
MALCQALLISMTGGKAPVQANGPRFGGHDGGNGRRRLDVIDGCQTKRIGHFGAEGQAHAAAFKVGRDEERNFGLVLKAREQGRLGLAIGREEARDATGLHAADRVACPGIDRAVHADDEKLHEAGVAIETRCRPDDPFKGRVIEMERRLSQEIGIG